MMLRTKHGIANYKVINKSNGEEIKIDLKDFLSSKQAKIARSKPDVIWQFSQYLKQHYQNQGQDISVYVDGKLSVNGKPFKPFINPEVDLANVDWNTFKHSEWILPSKQE